MASSNDTFKSSLFGQLKSYTNAVQGAFEQRIARPLLAFTRDFNRTSNDQINSSSSQPICQESTSSSSSPLEIIDVDTGNSFKSIFDKVRNTLSPSIKRRTSEHPNHDENKISHSTTKLQLPKHHTDHTKTVSFAENIENDSDSNEQYSFDDRKEIIRNAQTLAGQILTASIDQATGQTQINSTLSDDEEDFQRNFHSIIKPRRILNDNKEELAYQDLSAEIVAYVLKHAIRTLKKEQEQLILTTTTTTTTKNEENDGIIDLK